MDRFGLRAALADAGLGRVADAIVAQARPCISLRRLPMPDEQIPIGASKLGGAPDLPRSIDWPMGLANAMSFVGQIDLAQAAALSLEDDPEPQRPPAQQASFFQDLRLPDPPFPRNPLSVLPRSGRLSFFLEVEAVSRGYDIFDRRTWQVVYDDSDVSDLVRLPYPDGILHPEPLFTKNWVGQPVVWDPMLLRFGPCRLDLHADMSLPAGTDGLEGLELSEVEGSAYWEFNHPYFRELATNMNATRSGQPCHQMLGHARMIHGGTTSPGETLLAQIDSDPAANILWGDVGILQFFIRTSKLLAREFDDVLCLMNMH